MFQVEINILRTKSAKLLPEKSPKAASGPLPRIGDDYLFFDIGMPGKTGHDFEINMMKEKIAYMVQPT